MIFHLLEAVGFQGTPDFLRSAFHQKLFAVVIPFSALTGMLEGLLGLKILTIAAFITLLCVELISGVSASLQNGEKLSSKRFTRFIFKLFLWLSCFFIANAFSLQYMEGTIGNILFSWLHTVLVIFVTIEYFLSVLENIGKISGKSTVPLVQLIRKKLAKYIDIEDVKSKKK